MGQRCCGGTDTSTLGDVEVKPLFRGVSPDLWEEEETARGRKNRASSEADSERIVAEYFPMHTMSVRTFMALQAMESMGKMQARGALGLAAKEAIIHFISHEWLGFTHPDPNAEQLRRMQAVFQAVMEGRILDLFTPGDWKAYSEKVSAGSLGKFLALEVAATQSGKGVLTEASFGKHVMEGDVWLDYSSIPQVVDFEDPTLLSALQQRAVRSIPAYLERCDYFWVLTPATKHVDKGTYCNFTTWRSRGWCRLEEWGNFLSTNACAPLIITHSPKLSTIGFMDFIIATQGKPAMAPCNGAFTCCRLNHEMISPSGTKHKMPCDKDFVLPVLVQLFYNKRRHLRAQPDQKFLLTALVTCVRCMIFGGAPKEPPWGPPDLEQESVEDFLERVALDSIEESVFPGVVWLLAARAGHIPMLRKLQSSPVAMAMFKREDGLGPSLAATCAALGRVKVLEELLRMGLVRTDEIAITYNPSGITPIDRAAKYGFPDMVRYLLQMRAPADARRADGSTPLHGAAEAGHPDCCRALLVARADVNAIDKSGRVPLHLGADPVTFYGIGENKPEVLEVLLQNKADANARDATGRTALEIAHAALFHDGEEVFLMRTPV